MAYYYPLISCSLFFLYCVFVCMLICTVCYKMFKLNKKNKTTFLLSCLRNRWFLFIFWCCSGFVVIFIYTMSCTCRMSDLHNISLRHLGTCADWTSVIGDQSRTTTSLSSTVCSSIYHSVRFRCNHAIGSGAAYQSTVVFPVNDFAGKELNGNISIAPNARSRLLFPASVSKMCY